MEHLVYDIVGIVGVVLILLAYFLLQRGVIDGHQLRYLFMNLIGSMLVMISLTQTWNFPSFVIELCWMLISIYGIFRTVRIRMKGEEIKK